MRPAATAEFRYAPVWFGLLLIILVAGFWPSYFSKLGQGTIHPAHHVHGIAMLLWTLMLIFQPILIGRRQFSLHRRIGKSTFVLAPVIVGSGAWVNMHFIGRMEPPFPGELLAVFWFSFFLMIAFAILYALAIANRRTMARHARYMAATGLVFLIPGLARAYDFWVKPLTGWLPPFYLFVLIPAAIGVFLILRDHRHGKSVAPYAVFTSLWALNLALWWLLPHWPPWQRFSAWAAGLAA